MRTGVRVQMGMSMHVHAGRTADHCRVHPTRGCSVFSPVAAHLQRRHRLLAGLRGASLFKHM